MDIPLPGSIQLLANFAINPVVWKQPSIASEPIIGRGIFLERGKMASTLVSSIPLPQFPAAKKKMSKAKNATATSTSALTPALGMSSTVAVSTSLPLPLDSQIPITTIVTKHQGDLLAAQGDRYVNMMRLIQEGSLKADQARAQADRDVLKPKHKQTLIVLLPKKIEQ